MVSRCVFLEQLTNDCGPRLVYLNFSVSVPPVTRRQGVDKMSVSCALRQVGRALPGQFALKLREDREDAEECPTRRGRRVELLLRRRVAPKHYYPRPSWRSFGT